MVSEDQSVINLSWSASKSDGGSKIKRYIVEKRQLTPGVPTEWYKIGFTSPTETTFKVSEYFVEDATFNFRIIAENEAGKSTPLELKELVVLEKKKRVPEAPSYLRVKEKTGTSVTLSWRMFNIDNYSQSDKFIVEKREKNSTEWIQVGQTENETYTINDLDSKKSYFFRITSVNSAGQSQPTETQEALSMDISDELPSKPISISVESITQDSLTLNWISPRNSGSKPIIGYKIYKSSGNNNVWEECGQIGKSKTLSYTVIDLDFKLQYKFKICAYSDIGIGKPSETDIINLKKPIGNLF